MARAPTWGAMSRRYDDVLDTVTQELNDRLARLASAWKAEHGETLRVSLAPTRDATHGDFATAAALAAAKAWKRNPLEIAQAIAGEGLSNLDGVARLDAVKPGFVNITMAPRFWSDVVLDVLRLGPEYGKSDALVATGPMLIEFVSANPTGPLVVVQGRSSALGATLAAMFRFAGCKVETETYVNDAGTQLDVLADSLYARYATLLGTETPLPENGYAGEYLIDLARALAARDGDRWRNAPIDERRRALGRFARDLIVDEQRADLERFRVFFDHWTSETTLHESGAIEKAVEELRRLGHVFEKDEALWLRSTDFGDDKDRVLIRSDGRPTYLAADAAYHADKLRRGHRYLIDILGPDHHGYIARLSALVAALGHPGSLEVLLAQHVTFKRGGEAVSMSKRAGDLITLREVMDQVGVDAARFFFINRAPESHLVFDLELAVEQSSKNPVYYVQYGHARIASILRKAAEGRAALLERAHEGRDIAKLGHAAEIALIRRLADFGRTVASAAEARAPHRLAEYVHSVATDFHSFYTECIVLGDDDALTSARLSLCLAAKTVLASALGLMGVSAPEVM
ncbi:MAG: arginine--tRNA ligase [Candidatus Eremiobacteraeota bacterium]|nr:arginine--tRNA ligase [Candidatus Eremiobacteraeota bacterium]